ncbi:permease, cytosine/purine, uracil, thiamine, allantoin [Aspergillus tubingensis]|uniref:permease, cytosine/purine, uracil, thiamine, allantoin n=1 Tax=Aspergillus tubingensis TaxID=5068 RepID=UPI001579D526|nr:permease, cytosine/purine, uracil, thiamine, allantoin [Aspergillus tubingensis]GFN11958.1 permease, cytosine/purine, uracil, thiamine, allantoin [Aspergillus tubingensis]
MNKIHARLISLEAWKLAKEPSSLAPPGARSNKDLDLILPELRLWTALDFANYWVSDLVNITSWLIGTILLLVGLSTVNAIMIVMLSATVNMADFSCFSKSARGQWAQLLTIPIIKTVYAVLGLAVIGAGHVLDSRFLSFCCTMLWMLAQISCNLLANIISFGHDIMAIIPGWINVRASKFLIFMSVYGVFLSPICSIMIADYFIV